METEKRSIYDAGTLEIFWKNFVAGLGRAMGGVFIYVIFLVIAGYILANFVLPKVLPMINSYMDLLKSFSQMQNTLKTPQTIIPQDLLQQLNLKK